MKTNLEELEKAVTSMAIINGSDGSFYATDGKTVCTINVHNCGVFDKAYFQSLAEWGKWYGRGNCPVVQ